MQTDKKSKPAPNNPCSHLEFMQKFNEPDTPKVQCSAVDFMAEFNVPVCSDREKTQTLMI